MTSAPLLTRSQGNKLWRKARERKPAIGMEIMIFKIECMKFLYTPVYEIVCYKLEMQFTQQLDGKAEA